MPEPVLAKPHDLIEYSFGSHRARVESVPGDTAVRACTSAQAEQVALTEDSVPDGKPCRIILRACCRLLAWLGTYSALQMLHENTCVSEGQAIKQRVGLDALVGMVQPGVGIMDRTDTHALPAGKRQPHGKPVFEVESTAKLLLADPGFGK